MVALGAIVDGVGLSGGMQEHVDDIDRTVLLEQADFDLVPAHGGVLLDQGSHLDGQLRLWSMVLGVPARLNHVMTGHIQPHLPPLLNRKLRRRKLFLHLPQKVINRRVAPFILVEIGTERLRETFLSHKEQELFHGGRPFRVCDPVKDGLSDTGVDNRAADGMRGDHLVLVVAPTLALEEGRHAGFVVDRLAAGADLFEAEMGDEICEAFVKPEIVPPFHGDQIAEPVMGQLMRDGIGKGQHPFGGDFFLPHIEVIESDDPRVLHCPPLVLMRKHLVIFGEGELVPKELLEELHRFDCDFEDERCQLFEVVEERLDAED